MVFPATRDILEEVDTQALVVILLRATLVIVETAQAVTQDTLAIARLVIRDIVVGLDTRVILVLV